MTELPETLKALADTASAILAKEIEGVRKEAARHEEIRTLEHRAFMAEQRETVAALTRQVEERLATVKDGRDGIDGRDGQDADIEPVVKRVADLAESLTRQVADRLAILKDGVDGKDGRDGVDGSNGADGRDGIDGQNGADGADGKDADMDALRKHLEELVAAIPPAENGKDGRDGVDGKDAYPGEVKGVFDPDGEYRARDIVAHDGSAWIAKCDCPGQLPGEGWQLLASRGKRGDRGEAGKEGRKGDPGASIIAAYADTKNLQLILTRDDGEEVKADLYDLATVIKEG